jgi:hypothetical protein
MPQEVEHLPEKFKALDSIHSTENKRIEEHSNHLTMLTMSPYFIIFHFNASLQFKNKVPIILRGFYYKTLFDK